MDITDRFFFLSCYRCCYAYMLNFVDASLLRLHGTGHACPSLCGACGVGGSLLGHGAGGGGGGYHLQTVGHTRSAPNQRVMAPCR
jgi:hypothetical protein